MRKEQLPDNKPGARELTEAEPIYRDPRKVAFSLQSLRQRDNGLKAGITESSESPRLQTWMFPSRKKEALCSCCKHPLLKIGLNRVESMNMASHSLWPFISGSPAENRSYTQCVLHHWYLLSRQGEGSEAVVQQALGTSRGWALPLQASPVRQSLLFLLVTANIAVLLPHKNSPGCGCING